MEERNRQAEHPLLLTSFYRYYTKYEKGRTKSSFKDGYNHFRYCPSRIAGTGILRFFGITIFSFMIAGGVLQLIVAIELLTHGVWRFRGSTLPNESGVVPLAFPLLAGPGAITSVTISYGRSDLSVLDFV